jgi:ABC-type sugar transport system ATPase subunit
VRELRALHDRIGATTVYVTHDQTRGDVDGRRIAVMNNGVVEQVASPARHLRPAGHAVRRRLHRLRRR